MNVGTPAYRGASIASDNQRRAGAVGNERGMIAIDGPKSQG